MFARLVLLVGAIGLAACGDSVGNEGELVGGPCAGGAECDFRCETGGEFPGGTCTLPCNIDDDCPGGSHCINESDGICLLACELPEDCRAGYSCKGEENRGHGGDSLVCIADD